MPGPYTYNPGVPQGNQSIAFTQAPIQQNFQSIQSLVDVNHYDFGSALAGKHKLVEMPNQSGDPAADTNEMTLYAKQYGVTAQSEAYVLRNDLAGPNTPIPFTATANDNGSETAVSGWFFLPCGLIVKFGTYTTPTPIGTNTIIASLGPVITKQFNAWTSISASGNPLNYHAIVTGGSGNTIAVSWNGATNFNIHYLVLGTATP